MHELTLPAILITILWVCGTYFLGKKVLSDEKIFKNTVIDHVVCVFIGTMIQILLAFCLFILAVLSLTCLEALRGML